MSLSHLICERLSLSLKTPENAGDFTPALSRGFVNTGLAVRRIAFSRHRPGIFGVPQIGQHVADVHV